MREKISEQVERIVESGEDIRRKVSDAVADASRKAKDAGHGLVDVARSAIDGAVTAMDRAKPDDPESTLRKVVEGLGDGFQRTAQAAKLAIEEASGDGRAYAEHDVKRLVDDLKSLTTMFADVVEGQAKKAASQTRAQFTNIRDHAERTINAIRPSITSALDAAAHDPIGMAGESAKTAVKFTREAAGMLFSKIGEVLQSEKSGTTTD